MNTNNDSTCSNLDHSNDDDDHSLLLQVRVVPMMMMMMDSNHHPRSTTTSSYHGMTLQQLIYQWRQNYNTSPQQISPHQVSTR